MLYTEKDYQFLGVAGIDSLRLTFPWDEVDISPDSPIGKKVVTIKSTQDGEILTEDMNEQNSTLVWCGSGDGSYSVKLQKQIWFGQSKLCILLNSKCTERGYLGGLTYSNIGEVFRELNGKVFKMTIEQFLKGVPSDIDIKRDFYVPSVEEFDEVTNKLRQLSKISKKKRQGFNRFTGKKNKGIEWNERSYSTFANPFVKLYHKGIEGLYGDNNLFFEHYIGMAQLENRMRLEITIRTKKDAAKHNIDTTSLDTLLNTDKRIMEDAVSNSLLKCLTLSKTSQIQKAKGKMNNSDKTAYLLLVKTIKDDELSFSDALEHLLEHYPKGNERSRQKAKFKDIYEREIQGQDYEVKTTRMRGYLRAFGLL